MLGDGDSTMATHIPDHELFTTFGWDFTLEDVVEIAQQALGKHGVSLNRVWVVKTHYGWSLYVHKLYVDVVLSHKSEIDMLVDSLCDNTPDGDDEDYPEGGRYDIREDNGNRW